MGENLSQTVKIRIRNSLSVDRELWIEPFGDFVIVPSGGSVDIILNEKRGEISEIEIKDTLFLIHVWINAILITNGEGNITRLWGG